MMDIANAPCSWGIFGPGDDRATPDRYLDEVAEAGYRATELGPYGFLPTDPDALAAALDRRGLALVGSVHVHPFADPASGPALDKAVRAIAGLTGAVGAAHLVLMDGGDPDPEGTAWTLDADGWRAMAKMLDRARRIASDEFGMTLCFHPHVATAVEREDEIDRLLGIEGLALCFDTGHHAFWDQDPLAYMDKVWDRIAYMHLKNVDEAVRRRVRAGELGVRASFGQGVMCPLPDGAVDIGAVLDMLVARGFSGPVVVEQDLSDDPGASPLVLARRNAEFVRVRSGKVADFSV